MKTFDAWRATGIEVPPVFIVVCNNTTNSELVHDYIAGFWREDADGNRSFQKGRMDLFRNFDDDGARLARPRTLLIDSAQIESGGQIDDRFKAAATDEIEAFRKEISQRDGPEAARTVTDEQILREVMNTVGKKGRLGEQIRCVVSVSMLTEGWDANTVTHIMGVRAFGTRLICEQVMGRALRRLSYEADPGTGLFQVEYADIMGIDGLNLSKQDAVRAPVAKPREVTNVRAVPERAALEIVFPRVEGYRIELPDERIEADFAKIEPYRLTPEKTGPCRVVLAGIFGEKHEITVDHLKTVRKSTVVYHLAQHLLYEKFRDANEEPKYHLFVDARRIVKRFLDEKLACDGGTAIGQLLYRQLADEACDRIVAGIAARHEGEKPIKAVVDPYNPTGSTAAVNFNTTKEVMATDPRRCHVNYAVSDSRWEDQFCLVAEAHPCVLAYVKNHNLGFEIPYLLEGEPKRYRPDFIVRLDDGRGDPLNLVVEIKGFRGEDAKIKRSTAENLWVRGVNATGRFGRWDFLELVDPFTLREDFERYVDRALVPEPAE